MGLTGSRLNFLRLTCAFAIFMTGPGSMSLAASPAASPTPKIDLAFQRAREIVKTIDDRRLSIAGQTQLLDDAPARIISFVQSEVRLDIYRGSLRGGRGALLARSGNPLDQALLLDEMLSDAGFKTRLRKIALTPDQQSQLIQVYQNSAPSNLDYLAAPKDLARAVGLKAEVVEAARADRRKNQREILATAERWTASLAPIKATLSQAATDWEGLARWFYLVEYRDQNRWILANPLAGFDPETGGELAGFSRRSLPAAMQHQFSLRVLLQLQNPSGEQSKKTLVEFSAAGSALYLTPISIEIAPDGLDISRANTDIARALDSQNMVLTLTAGPNHPAQTRYFNRNGEVSKTRALNAAAVADVNTGGLAGIGGALGGIFGNTPAPKQGKPELTDIVVEYSITTPQGTQTIRRRSLARLQKVDKIERAVFWGADIFVNLGPIPRQVVALSRLKTMLAMEPLLHVALTNPAAGFANALDADTLQTLNEALVASTATAAVEFSLIAQEIARQKSARLYQPAPTIIALEGILLQANGEISGKTVLDIATLQTARVDCNAGVCSPPSPQTRFEDGIIWTAAERAYLADLTDPARSQPVAKRRAAVANAGSSLENALSRGQMRLNLIDSGAALEEGAAKVGDKTVRAAMRRNLNNGYLPVIAGDGTSAANWWRLDPVTGLMLGTGLEGRGQSATDETVLVSNAVALGRAMASFGSMLGCLYGLGGLQNNKKIGSAYFAGKAVFCITSSILGITSITGQLGVRWGAVGFGNGIASLAADAYEINSAGGASGTDIGALGFDVLGVILAIF